MHLLTTGLTDFNGVSNDLLWQISVNWQVLAQDVKDPHVLNQMQNAFTHFIKSGQAWAFFFGIIIGYMIKNLLPG